MVANLQICMPYFLIFKTVNKYWLPTKHENSSYLPFKWRMANNYVIIE